MRRLTFIFCLVLLLPVISGCTDGTSSNGNSNDNSGQVANSVKGSGNVVTEPRQVSSAFTEIELATVGTLKIEQGDTASLTMEGEDNILPLILSEQEGSRLVIRAANTAAGFSASRPLTYTLKAPSLSYIATSNAGNIEVGPLQASDLTTVASNAGNIKLQGLSATTYKARLTNAGSIAATGKVDSLEVTLTNAGSYRGKTLQSRTARVSTSNVGSATVNASERVDATIDNVGNVYYVDYLGSPQVTRSGKGMGRVVPIRPDVSLTPCTIAGGVTAECGTYRVYEDRVARAGRTIDLRLALVRASTSERTPDPVVYLAGGPGGSAIDSATGIGPAFRSLNQHHDWLLIDQRGTGGSNMLLYPPPPADVMKATSVQQIEDILRPFVEKALRELPGNLRFYTTSVAVDDIDEVAQALGYEQVNLYGGSYGATVVQYYLRQHGDHVRTAIMDGGTLLDVPIFELIAPNGQRALDLVFKRCEADQRCHEAYPRVRAEMQEVYTRLSGQPVVLKDVIDPLTGEPLVLTADTFAEVVRQQLLSARAASMLPRMIHQAYAGTYSEVLQPYMQYAGQVGQGSRLVMYTAIRCSEAWAKAKPDEVAALGKDAYFLGTQMMMANQLQAVCSLLPKGIVPPKDGERVKSSVPVLILTGEADPQDPASNVAGAEKDFPNSLQVVAPAQGHGVIQYGCLYKVAQDFVDSGTTRGLDTSCVRDMMIPSFSIGK